MRELVDVDAVPVLADFDELHAEAAKDRDRGEIRWRAHHNRITLVEQQSANELDHLLYAIRHQYVFMRYGDAVLRHVSRDPSAQLGNPGLRPVLQGLSRVPSQCGGCFGGEIGKHAAKRVSGIKRYGASCRRRGQRGRQGCGAARKRGLFHRGLSMRRRARTRDRRQRALHGVPTQTIGSRSGGVKDGLILDGLRP